MPSPVRGFRDGLARSRAKIGGRADDHAQRIVRELRRAFYGDEHTEALEELWLRPEAITLTRLTMLLTERGHRSALNTPLTPTAVDRACRRGGFDWRRLKLELLANRISLNEAGNLAQSVAPKQTATYRAMKIRRRLEHNESLRERMVRQRKR